MPPAFAQMRSTPRQEPVAAAVVAKGSRSSALHCLNFLVADALELVPDALEYLRRVKTPQVFKFCAIPQVMAIATLDACFDNPRVFTGVVKIRKGMAARLILACGSIAPVEAWFYSFARRMESRCPADDPSRAKLLAATATIVDLTAESARRLSHGSSCSFGLLRRDWRPRWLARSFIEGR